MAKNFGETYNEFGERTEPFIERVVEQVDFIDLQSVQTPDGVPLSSTLRSSELIYDTGSILSGLGDLAELDELDKAKYFESGIVTNDKLKDVTVEGEVLSALSVDSAQLANSSIASNLIENSAIETGNIVSISGSKVTTGTISLSQIATATLDNISGVNANAKLAGRDIFGSHIQGGAVTSAKINSNTISSSDLEDKISGGTYSPPGSVTVDTYGRVTSIS